MSGIFHEGRWYENTDMICRRCGRPVYDSDNPEYRYPCFHCDEDFYSIEVEEQDALYLPPVMVARPVDGITLNEALEYLLDDTGKTRIFQNLPTEDNPFSGKIKPGFLSRIDFSTSSFYIMANQSLILSASGGNVGSVVAKYRSRKE